MERLNRNARLQLRTPIVQAVLGACGSPNLVAAVANAGGLGTLAVHELRPADARRLFTGIRRRTRRPMLVAFTGEWERDEVLDAALESGFNHFQVFWWNADRLVRRIHGAGAIVFQQVGTEAQVIDALRRGVDGLVVQGTEAGGPVRSPVPVRALTAQVRALVGDDLPIIAGGGCADRADAEALLRVGADAVLFGTRFLLTEEAAATNRDKGRLIRATTRNLVLDTRLVGSWPCAPRRRLVTAFDEDRPSLFAGLGIDKIRSVEPAARVVRNLTPR